jgi:hypothetical protein
LRGKLSPDVDVPWPRSSAEFVRGTLPRLFRQTISAGALHPPRTAPPPTARQSSRLSNPGTDVMIFKNIFAEKFREKIGVFDSKQS